MKWQTIENIFLDTLRRWSIPILRVSLGIVFLWFGALKILGVSPVEGLVESTYSFMPYPAFFLLLGAWEAAIGLGLIFKKALRLVLPFLWLQMLGTFGSLVLLPPLFFQHGNFFLLTIEGEFVIKNLVLIAASMATAGYEMKQKS